MIPIKNKLIPISITIKEINEKQIHLQPRNQCNLLINLQTILELNFMVLDENVTYLYVLSLGTNIMRLFTLKFNLLKGVTLQPKEISALS